MLTSTLSFVNEMVNVIVDPDKRKTNQQVCHQHSVY